MFGFIGRRKQRKRAARKLYDTIVQQARKPVFYTKYKVPDTADGRFDLILLHAFLVHNRIRHEADSARLEQALFDYMFRELDKALREMGVGDLKVPRQMKYMMASYKGRLVHYTQALEEGGAGALAEALRRNLYRKTDDVGDEVLKMQEKYIRDNVAGLERQDWSVIREGEMMFKGPAV